MSILTFFETLWQDLRFGARTLGRHPGFAAVAVLTLGLGIGANAAIFSVVNAVLLRPLPWADPDRAVMIWSRWTAFDKTWVASGELMDYRRRATTLEQVAAWGDGQVNLTGDGDPERVAAGGVTANTFSTFGVRPLLGRTFTAQEDVPNGPNLVVLGHALWSRRYAADPGIVGRSILIDGRPIGSRRRHAARVRAADGLPESRAHPGVDAAAARSGEHRSRQPRTVRRGAPEAGRHGEPGRQRAARHREGHDERGALPAADAVRHRRALADG